MDLQHTSMQHMEENAMKVTEVNVYVVQTDAYKPPVVELITDEGITGIGEGAVGFGTGANAAAVMMRDLAQRFILGKDPRNINGICSEFYFHTFWAKGGGTVFYAGVSALEQAMWDIKAQALGVPVYELFGGRQRDRIHFYANDWADKGFLRPEDLAERAVQVKEDDGYDAMKMYPLNKMDPVTLKTYHLKNREVTIEDERMAYKVVGMVRDAIGPETQLMLDVTAEGPAGIMKRIGKNMEQFDLNWYEEILDPFDPEGYKSLHDSINIPIAGGERLCTRLGFRRLIESRGVDIVQPDPGICGGFREVWAIGMMAEAYSMQIAPHNCGGPVLTAAAVQMAACLSNFYIQEVYPYSSEMHYSIVEDPLEMKIKNSYLDVPTAPGIGVKLNHKVVDPHRVAHLDLSDCM